MDQDEQDIIKVREIAFVEFHPDPDQAGTAAPLLSELPGVETVSAVSPTLLEIRYNVLTICLEQLEGALIGAGFHLSNRLMHKLRRALYYYTEEIERENNGCPPGDLNDTKQVFINRYQQRQHGCQDQRPEHWRKYL